MKLRIMFDNYAHLKINGYVYTYSDYYDSIVVYFEENILIPENHTAWIEWIIDKIIRLEIGDDLTEYFILTQVATFSNRMIFYKNVIPRNQPISWYNEGF